MYTQNSTRISISTKRNDENKNTNDGDNNFFYNANFLFHTHTAMQCKKRQKKKGNTSVYKLSNIIISFNVYENLNVILTVTITLNVRRTKHNLILIYIEKKNNRIID